MKCIVLGDIGWQYLYHLGDEAMTEAAIDQLHARGVSEITLVAAQPRIAEDFYQRPAVKRFGFSSKWSREKLESELDRITRGLGDADSSLETAMRDADAAIIAGGGNMNSDHAYHLYERVAYKRLAEHFSVPLFVSSQTIGPMLRPRDNELVAEIIEYAECFGARELVSYGIAIDNGGSPGRVVHTMDDAMMLRSRPEDHAHVSRLGLSNRYIVASFTSHQGTTGLTEEDYVQHVANMLDEVADRFDLDVALAPHTGSLDTSMRKGDQLLNDALVASSSSGRLRALEMPTARQVVALTEGALLSISSRYHPTVFAPAAQIPTASLSLSYYSSVRMRGSMSNVGLSNFVVPATSWSLAMPAIAELLERSDAYREHIRGTSSKRDAEQAAWWDSIAAAIRTGNWNPLPNISSAPEFAPLGDWSDRVEHVTPVFDLFGKEKVWSKWFRQDALLAEKAAAAADSESAAASKRADKLEQELNRISEKLRIVEARKSVRFADTVGRAFQKLVRR